MIWNRTGFQATARRGNEMGETTVDLPEHLEELLGHLEGQEPRVLQEPVELLPLGAELRPHQGHHLLAETGGMGECPWLVWVAALAQERRRSLGSRLLPPCL